MPDTNQEANAEQATLAAARARGASWFVWLAGLSLVNTALTAFGADRHFVFGLGVTELIDAFFSEAPLTARIIGYVIDALIAGLFILFWRLSARRTWPFFLGATLYLLDALLFVLAQEWVGVAIHAWVLFSLVRGLMAAMKMSEAAPMATSTTVPAPPV